jgi:GTPase SAR1 family protein
MTTTKRISMLLFGDGGCGKTALTIQFVEGKFYDEYDVCFSKTKQNEQEKLIAL